MTCALWTDPNGDAAQQMLQNPALLQQLRQKLLTSGLTPDQVRARLRAEGYPENLLDAYLPGSTTSRTNRPYPEVSPLPVTPNMPWRTSTTS